MKRSDYKISAALRTLQSLAWERKETPEKFHFRLCVYFFIFIFLDSVFKPKTKCLLLLFLNKMKMALHCESVI